MEYLVSIIMSTYNENKEQLNASINSILNQSYKNLQIIIVNDNPSNLMLKNTLEKYCCEDSRIIIINNKENIGLIKSLNKAIERSTGYYIARMDADDISKTTRIEDEIKFLTENKLDAVSSHVVYINENGNVLEKQDDTFSVYDISPFLKYRNIVFHSTVLMKSEIIKKIGYYKEVFSAEDLELWIRITNSGYKFGILSDKLVYYRIRENGISKQNQYTQYLTAEFICKECCKNKKNFDLDELNKYLIKNKYLDNDEINKFVKVHNNYDKIIYLLSNRKLIQAVIKFLFCSAKDIRLLYMFIKTFKIKILKIYM